MSATRVCPWRDHHVRREMSEVRSILWPELASGALRETRGRLAREVNLNRFIS